MEEVKEQIAFHCQRAATDGEDIPLWEVGQPYEIGEKNNLFFEHYNQRGMYLWSLDGNRLPYVSFLEQFVKIPSDKRTYNTDHILRLTADALKREVGKVRELAFEEVRQTHYLDLPSRQTCVWFAPTEESALYWDERITGSKRWLRCHLKGKMHIANDEWFRGDTVPLNEIRNYAYRYWRGDKGPESRQDELLFTGTVKVIELVDLEELRKAQTP